MSNCILWALYKRLFYGGCFKCEWTRYNKIKWIKWPHCWWKAPDGTEWEYMTEGPKRKIIIPPPLFIGKPQIRNKDGNIHGNKSDT